MFPTRLSRLRGRRILGVPLAVAAVAVTAVAVIGGGAYAAVAAVPGNASPALAGCVNSGRTADHLYTNPGNFPGCPSGEAPFSLSSGVAGPAGKNAIVSTVTTDLGGAASVATGGSFVANSTEVGTGIKLKAGTYMISVNAKATPDLTSAVQVFPEFFVYNQVKNAAFTGDVLNVGAGALESGGHVTIDSYYSGTAVITLAADTTLHFYAFGYDSDTGAGTYVLDDLTVTATQLNVAS